MGWLKRIFSGDEVEVQQEGVSTTKPRDVTDFKKLERGLEYCDLKVGSGGSPSQQRQGGYGPLHGLAYKRETLRQLRSQE